MVDQQLQLPQPLLTRTRAFQPRLPQRRPGDRERVDRVRLAAHPARPPLRRHQLRRHPHQPLARSDQRPLERTGQLPAVLERPQPLLARATPPTEQLLPSPARSAQRPAGRPRRRRPPSATACARPPQHDHSDRLLNHWGRPASGQASLEAAAKLLSGHARRSREGGGDTTLASRPPRRHPGIESAAANPSLCPHRTPPPADDDSEFGNVT